MYEKYKAEMEQIVEVKGAEEKESVEKKAAIKLGYVECEEHRNGLMLGGKMILFFHMTRRWIP